MIYRQGRFYENCNKVIFDGAGIYDMPRLKPVKLEPGDIDPDSFMGFNYAKTCKTPDRCGVHFFIDDYQFTRVWTQPDIYLDLLRSFKYVCSPDFSMYTDFPRAVQIFNCYRNHWLGAYWQMHGVNVIPCVMWADEDSLEWCFDGDPVGSAVIVSSVGTQMNKSAQRVFLTGYQEMLKRLQPSLILFHGSIPDECKADNVIKLRPFQDKLKKRINDSASAGGVI